MSSAYAWDAIAELPLSGISSLLKHAAEQEQEQVTWALWQRLYPMMYAGWVPALSYLEYKRALHPADGATTEKASEEIVDEMLAVVATYEGRC